MYIKVTSFEESQEGIRTVRDTVFGEELKVRRELDWDGNDPHCLHAVATDEGGNPIGTGRVQPNGRIGRLAVLEPWRNQGVGSKMLEVLVESACGLGLEMVTLHAQVHAIPFYEKNGFEAVGPEFQEAGIQHVNMTRDIQQSHEY